MNGLPDYIMVRIAGRVNGRMYHQWATVNARYIKESVSLFEGHLKDGKKMDPIMYYDVPTGNDEYTRFDFYTHEVIE